MYREIRRDHQSVLPKLVLKVNVRAMIVTIGENGLVPSFFVLGFFARFPITGTKISIGKERMKALATARVEKNAIISEQKIMTPQ